jgi:hypothetical protein
MASRSALLHRQVKRAPLPEPVAGPVIKWVGGKTKLLPELTARLPEHAGHEVRYMSI